MHRLVDNRSKVFQLADLTFQQREVVRNCMAKHHGAGEPPPSVIIENVENTTRGNAGRTAETIQRYSEVCTKAGPTRSHPFRGVRELSLQPTDLDRLVGKSAPLAEQIDTLSERYKKVASYLEIPDKENFLTSNAYVRFSLNSQKCLPPITQY